MYIQKNFKLKSIKNRATITCKYERKDYYRINTIINKLKKSKGKKSYFYMGDGIRVKTSTSKNTVFINNYEKYNECKCEICGMKAEYFALERLPNADSYHFNLYAINPTTLQEVYFNIDHIKPKAKGGTNDVINKQLTCENCNTKKGDTYNKYKTFFNKILKLFK